MKQEHTCAAAQAYDDLEMHWAADMALRLLQARHASRQQSNGSSSRSSSASDSSSATFWGPWVDSLPQRVVTPVEFTTQEVEQLVMPSTVQVCGGCLEGLMSMSCCQAFFISATVFILN